jgi:hypothetical protein
MTKRVRPFVHGWGRGGTQLLKVSRKCKRLLSKRHYKAFKIFKALKLLKVVRLSIVVLCIESSVVPAGARFTLLPNLPVCKLPWAAAR